MSVDCSFDFILKWSTWSSRVCVCVGTNIYAHDLCKIDPIDINLTKVEIRQILSHPINPNSCDARCSCVVHDCSQVRHASKCCINSANQSKFGCCCCCCCLARYFMWCRSFFFLFFLDHHREFHWLYRFKTVAESIAFSLIAVVRCLPIHYWLVIFISLFSTTRTMAIEDGLWIGRGREREIEKKSNQIICSIFLTNEMNV